VAQDLTPQPQPPEVPVPQQALPPAPLPPPPAQQQVELPFPPQQVPQAPPPAPQASVPPPASMVPAPQTAPTAPGAPSELDGAVIAIIGQLAPELDRQFRLQTPPAEVAQGIIAENGTELVKMALGVASIDQVIRHLSSNPGSYGNLVSRNGQKFLREIWKTAGEAVGA
jgi:hypothetical protein